MNKANKITISRIILAFIIILFLLFPFDLMGFDFPKYLLKNSIIIDLKYVISGILFIIASLSDIIDGYVARKNNIVTDFGKLIDSIADKILINSVLIILACYGKISVIVTVVIIVRDIVVDSIKMLLANHGVVVGEIKISKIKTATVMIGIVLTLFYNLPFEFFNIRISDFILVISAIFSVISGFEYYRMSKGYLLNR